MATAPTYDLIIIGGGLSGGLLALACQRAHPERRILMIEGRPALGGNHLWSFLDSDIDAGDKPLLEPLISYGWRQAHVIFPAYQRTIGSQLYGVRSDRFDAVLRATLPPESILTGKTVIDAGPTWVEMESGTRIEAKGVVDARGGADLGLLDPGWRKFVGYELQLAGPHSVRHARIIDAGVEVQEEGLSYCTLLPIEKDTLFIEEVRYGRDPTLNVPGYAKRIFNLAARFGWKILDSARGQAGVIPITTGGDFDAYWDSGSPGVAKVGVRAALFHPVTGASLPDAARTARMIAEMRDWSGEALHRTLHAHAAKIWGRRDYYRRFARSLLDENALAEQYKPLEVLYTKEPGTIARFHNMRMTMMDRIGLSLGDGPMPLSAALKG